MSEVTIPAHWARDTDGLWHHVGATFDGREVVVVYIDGVRTTTPPPSTTGGEL